MSAREHVAALRCCAACSGSTSLTAASVRGMLGTDWQAQLLKVCMELFGAAAALCMGVHTVPQELQELQVCNSLSP